MVPIPGGTFTMGSERFYPEEAPQRRVKVDPFWIDATPVTNRQFSEFVRDTGHCTFAETAPNPADYPGMPPEMAKAGSLVFAAPDAAEGLHDYHQWWDFRFGANWRQPLGPNEAWEDLSDHPVVHVTHGDAKAYAEWAGKSLPTEAEWEFAARGGHEKREYEWGDELAPGGKMLANYWQGQFPDENTLEDGFRRTSPVRYFPANDFGLYDMIGNVWEWTADWYALPLDVPKSSKNCCVIDNPRGGLKKHSIDRSMGDNAIARRVTKGGSHLCAANYCRRYRPAARQGQSIDSSTSHIGFRCVVRDRKARQKIRRNISKS